MKPLFSLPKAAEIGASFKGLKEAAEARLRICKVCPSMRMNGPLTGCKECGCVSMEAKSYFPGTCPLKKW